MAVATLTDDSRVDLAVRWNADTALVVVALCAAWCTTCGEFRRMFERLAEANAEALFVWLDVEDDAAVCGDVDVENFPTLAIFRGDTLLHYGITLPLEGTVARLIAEMTQRAAPAADVPEPVLRLPALLRAWRA